MFPKIGVKPPKMDGENNGTPYEQMDDLGGFSTYFWKHPSVESPFFGGFSVLKPCGFTDGCLRCCRSLPLPRQQHSVWGLRRAMPRRNVWMVVAWFEEKHHETHQIWHLFDPFLVLLLIDHLGNWVFQIILVVGFNPFGGPVIDWLFAGWISCMILHPELISPIPRNNEADRAFLGSSSF